MDGNPSSQRSPPIQPLRLLGCGFICGTPLDQITRVLSIWVLPELTFDRGVMIICKVLMPLGKHICFGYFA